MTTFELVIGLLLACAVLSLLARWLRAPYPAFLALGGAGLALVPGMPVLTLDPELALALFVAPVLLDAAYDSSPRDLRAHWLPVSSLVLAAVGLTVVAVAVVAKLLVPGMPWAAAVALGAIVAPPDAAAATAVLRQLSPPHRVMVILEGESLLNDATALLIYRGAVAAAAGSITAWQAGPMLLLTALGGVVLGWALAQLSRTVIRMIDDIPTSVLMQFLLTFAVWILADRIGVSAVITVVVYAVTLARNPSKSLDAEHRRASYAVWDVAVFVLNALAFILVGLQLRPILARADGAAWAYAGFAGAVFVTVVAVRIAWVAAHGGITRLLRPGITGSAREGTVIGWSGMRGLVTLATALALPDGTHGGPAFPYRDLLIAASFAVVLGTLVLQGLTLRPLIAALNLTEDSDVAGEVARARAATAEAALAALDGDGSEAAAGLRREYEARRVVARGGQHDAPRVGPLLQVAVAAERRVLFEMRARDEIGDDAFHVVEEELDWAEVNANLLRRRAAG